MKFKALLLDIDDTVYDYKTAHKYGMNMVYQYCEANLKSDRTITMNAFNMARKKVHIELGQTAASHNRLLYFQKMLEILDISSLQYGMKLYNTYWDNFLDKMVVFEGIYSVLEKYKSKICLVTDLTAHIQYRKIKKLQLEQYCDFVVTSEEAGKEKPHPYIFMMALQKMQLKPSDVCMIGDNYKKDIVGASNLDIMSIWINHNNQKEDVSNPLITEVKKVNEIIELI